MSVLNPNAAFRSSVLGAKASKSYTLAVETAPLFTVAGGLIALTSITGLVTTAITTAATTVRLQFNPTAGTSTFLSAASGDIGTSDTAVGEILAADLVPATGITIGAKPQANPWVALSAGQVEQITVAGITGVILWTATWVPIDDGATLVAA